jgi:hypothetical protein
MTYTKSNGPANICKPKVLEWIGLNSPSKCASKCGTTEERCNAGSAFFRFIPEAEIKDHSRENAGFGSTKEKSHCCQGGEVMSTGNT